MFPLELKTRKKTHRFECESEFKELSAKQLIYFAGLYAKKLSKSEVLNMFSYKFRKMSFRLFWKMNKYQRADLAAAYSWLYGEYCSGKVIITSFKHKGRTYYGPSDNLSNVLVEEWMNADPAARNYQASKDEKFLSALIAHLYRPKAKHPHVSDQRELYDENTCNDRISTMSKIPQSIRMGILLNYAAIRQQMAKDFPEVFSGGGSGKNFGIPGMIHDMAGPELGTITEIQKQFTIRNLLFIAQKNEIRRKTKKSKP